jgi:single-strand DNA-binding protein
MVNKVMLVGHLGGDPQMNKGADGKAVAVFSLATSERWTDRATGEKRDRTEWHRVVVLAEGLAGVAEKYLHKGSRVYVEGKNQTRKYTDNQGVARTVTEVVLPVYGGQLVLCDRAEGRAPPPAGEATGEGPRMDDELPF